MHVKESVNAPSMTALESSVVRCSLDSSAQTRSAVLLVGRGYVACHRRGARAGVCIIIASSSGGGRNVSGHHQ